MPTDTTVIDRLRAPKTCEEEPSRCYFKGPMCELHLYNDDFTPLLREAADEIVRLTDALTAAHAARDAAERKALHESRVADTLARQYQDRTDEVYALRAQLTTALRERDEARAALEAARYSCDHEGVCLFIDTKPDGTR